MHWLAVAPAVLLAVVMACGAPQENDVVIRNGTICDGSGGAARWRPATPWTWCASITRWHRDQV